MVILDRRMDGHMETLRNRRRAACIHGSMHRKNKFMKGWMQQGGSDKRATGRGRRRVTEEAAMGKRENERAR